MSTEASFILVTTISTQCNAGVCTADVTSAGA